MELAWTHVKKWWQHRQARTTVHSCTAAE